MIDHLDNNSNLYKRLLSQPISSHDAEPPTAQDALIDTITNHELQTEQLLCWVKYIQWLKDGAWGNHKAIQGIGDMFDVTVNVLSNQNPMATMIFILPRSYIKYASHGEFSVCILRLIMQYHYVGCSGSPGSSSPVPLVPWFLRFPWFLQFLRFPWFIRLCA